MTAGTHRSRPQHAPKDQPTGEGLSFTLSQRAHASRVVEIVAPVIPAPARALQPRIEVVVHDLTHMPNTTVVISDDVTGRKVGGPRPDLGLLTFRSDNPQDMVNYRTQTAEGLALRSASMFFRAPAGKPVAAMYQLRCPRPRASQGGSGRPDGLP